MARQKMVRKQLYVLPSQAELLKEKAATYSVSEGELVRMALDKYLSASTASDSVEASLLDLSIWEDEEKFISQRWASMGTGQESDAESMERMRIWKRSDLYDR